MPDQIETIQRRVKFRTVEISIINAGPAIEQKSVIFKHTVCPSSADGATIGKVMASITEQVRLESMLADPRVQQAMALIDAVAQDRCAANREALLAMIAEE